MCTKYLGIFTEEVRPSSSTCKCKVNAFGLGYIIEIYRRREKYSFGALDQAWDYKPIWDLLIEHEKMLNIANH